MDKLSGEHLAHCINYLKAPGREVALLLNFEHPKVDWKRVVQEEA